MKKIEVRKNFLSNNMDTQATKTEIIEGVKKLQKQFGLSQIVILTVMCDVIQALILESKKGNTETVKILIDKGVKLDLQDEKGMTALMWASVRGHTDQVKKSEEHTKIAKMLIDAGAKLDLQDKDDRTALHWTSIHGHAEVAKMLIDKKANLDIQDNDERVAILYALLEGRPEVAKMLTDAGAKLDIPDKDCFTVDKYNQW